MQINKTSVRLVERLKAKQAYMGLNQADFATFLGITQGKLSKLYSGKQGVGSGTLHRLMETCPDIFLPEYMQIVQPQGESAREEE